MNEPPVQMLENEINLAMVSMIRPLRVSNKPGCSNFLKLLPESIPRILNAFRHLGWVGGGGYGL